MQLLQGGCLSKSTTGLDRLQEMEEHRLLLGGEVEICILICHVMAVNIVSYEKHFSFLLWLSYLKIWFPRQYIVSSCINQESVWNWYYE